MSKINYQNEKIITLVIGIFAPLIFTILFWRFGLEDSDSGFLLGLGWRIFNSEYIYRDFLYIRPPLSPLISSLYIKLLPDYGQVFWIRIINNYQLMGGVLLTFHCLKKYYDFNNIKARPSAMILLSFILTSSFTLNFQWHTTDGLFLALLGYYFVVNLAANNYNIVLAGALMVASAMTKQNFYLIPIFGAVLTYYTGGFRVLLRLISTYIFCFGLIFVLADHFGIFDDFLRISSSAGNIKDIFIAGVLAYFANSEYFYSFVFLLMIEIILFRWYTKSKTNLAPWVMLFIAINLTLFNVIYILFSGERELLVRYDRILAVTEVTILLLLLIEKKEKIKSNLFLLILLCTSWSTSISWGGMTPGMYLSPLIFLAYYLLSKYTNSFHYKKINTVVFILLITMSLTQSLVPYRDKFIWNINRDGGELSNKLAFIKVNDERFAKHAELKSIINAYHNIVVLPSMPAIYYIYGINNEFVLDWAMDIEAGGDVAILKTKINECCEYIVIEKKLIGQVVGKPGSRFYSSMTDYVTNNFVLQDSLGFFDIYRNDRIQLISRETR